VRNWGGFDPKTEEGILPLQDLVTLFSGRYFRRRLDPDWVSHIGEYGLELINTLREMGKTGPFWKRPKT